MQKINLDAALAGFEQPWSPRIVGELNGQHVKLVWMDGKFIWHHHEAEDEMFLVLAGHLTLEMRDRIVELDSGEFFIVPRGIEHRPVARGRTAVLLFEPASTLNTGNIRDSRTIDHPAPLDGPIHG